MTPPGWTNPITVGVGQTQTGVDPNALLPYRVLLERHRIDLQRRLNRAGTPRFSPIQVTPGAVIWDGHHAVRLAAEDGRTVDVEVVEETLPFSGSLILQLPVV